MFKCSLEKSDWKQGRAAALAGKVSTPPRGCDGLSWMSGYLDGKAERDQDPADSEMDSDND